MSLKEPKCSGDSVGSLTMIRGSALGMTTQVGASERAGSDVTQIGRVERRRETLAATEGKEGADCH